MNNIIKFLNNNKIEYNDTETKPTHLVYGINLQGKFNLDKQQNKQFLKLYRTYLSENNNKSELQIIEKQNEMSKIVIDIDIKKNINENEDVNKRLYNKVQYIK